MTVIDVTGAYYIPPIWPRLAMDLKRVDGIAIHHTVTFFLKPSATAEEEQDHIAMIHRYHVSKGWLGFAYHLISFPSGRVYLVVPLTQWGTHVKGENDHLEAIAVAGDFTDRVPGLPQQQGVVEGIRHIYATLGREVPIRPHRYWSPTSCPGATYLEWVPQLRDLVEEESMSSKEYETLNARISRVKALHESNRSYRRRAGHLAGNALRLLYAHSPALAQDRLDDLIDEAVALKAAIDGGTVIP